MELTNAAPKPETIPDRVTDHGRSTPGFRSLSPGWHVWDTGQPTGAWSSEWDALVAGLGGDVTQTSSWMEYVLHTGAERCLLVLLQTVEGPRAASLGMVIPSGGLFRARHLRFPQYPVLYGASPASLSEAFRAVEAVAKKRGYARVEYVGTGCNPLVPASIPPEYATRKRMEYVVDLTDGPTALWQAMHKDQRRNVRFSERQGVRVVRMDSRAGVQAVRSLQLEVARRHAEAFQLRNSAAYDAFHDALVRRGLARVYTGQLEDKVVMACICTTFNGLVRGIYNGANSEGLRVRASTAVIWQAIRDMAEEGYATFSFGMADPGVESPDAPAYGLHRFKLDLGARTRDVTWATRDLAGDRTVFHRLLSAFGGALGGRRGR